MLEVDSTALICISTPQDDMNFYSAMFDMKLPDGSPLFVTLEVSLVCDACKQSDHPERCPHMTDEIRKLIYLFCLQLNTNNFFSSMEECRKIRYGQTDLW